MKKFLTTMIATAMVLNMATPTMAATTPTTTVNTAPATFARIASKDTLQIINSNLTAFPRSIAPRKGAKTLHIWVLCL